MPSRALRSLCHSGLISFLAFSTVGYAQVPTGEVPAQAVVGHANQVLSQSDSSNCEIACAKFSKAMADKQSYSRPENLMWDGKQDDYSPVCRVTPTTSEDVAQILSVLVEEQCHFAVKSGGHSRIPNSSNSDGGVTIDLARISAVEINEKDGTAKIGSGALWLDVYKKLEEKDLMVVGGRVADVGVGGFILGGGIGFFSPKHGWASDNVAEYEMVLPNSTIVHVTPTQHPDLYSALRGGSNNFGIITHFTLETFPQGPQLGGSKSYSADKTDAVLAALNPLYTTNDLDVAFYIACLHYQAYGMNICVVQQHHAKPDLNPDSLAELEKIEAMGSSMRIDRMSNITVEVQGGSSHGTRNIYSTLTIKHSLELEQAIVKMFYEELESVKHIEGIVPVVVMQPLHQAVIQRSAERGGAGYKIESDVPLTIFSTANAWIRATDDDAMHAFDARVMDKVRAMAEKRGMLHPFIYQNYASANQDVFASYGAESLDRMKKTQREVDPKGVFAKGGLCGGYFKVNEVPLENLIKEEKKERQARDEL